MPCRCGEKGKDGGCCRDKPTRHCGCVKNDSCCGPACACGTSCNWKRDDSAASEAAAEAPLPAPPRPDPLPWPPRAASAADLADPFCGCGAGGCRKNHGTCGCKKRGTECGSGCGCGGSCEWNQSTAPKPRPRVQPGTPVASVQSYHDEFEADPALSDRVKLYYKCESASADALRQGILIRRRKQIGALRGDQCPYTGVPTGGLQSDAPGAPERVFAVDHIVEMQLASLVFDIVLARLPRTTYDEVARARSALYELLHEDWNLALTTRQVNETKRDVFKPFVGFQGTRPPQVFSADCPRTGLILKGVADKGVLNHTPIRDSDEARILALFCAAAGILCRKLREAGLPLLRCAAEEVEKLVALSGVPAALELDAEALEELGHALETGPVSLSLASGRRRSKGPAPAGAAPSNRIAAPANPARPADLARGSETDPAAGGFGSAAAAESAVPETERELSLRAPSFPAHRTRSSRGCRQLQAAVAGGSVDADAPAGRLRGFLSALSARLLGPVVEA